MGFHFLSLLASLLLPFFVSAVVYTDPYIYCLEQPLPPADSPWPDFRTPISYPGNLQLCSAFFGNQYNLGCLCTHNSGPIDCGHNAPDPILLYAQMNPEVTGGATSFVQWCSNHCACLPMGIADQLREESGSTVSDDTSSTSSIGDNSNSTGGGTMLGGLTLDETESESGTTDPGEVSDSGSNTCGAKCTSMTDCSGRSCYCKSVSQTYIPGSNTFFYESQCTLLSRKREEMGPCPCNASMSRKSCTEGNNDTDEPHSMCLMHAAT